MNPSEYDVTFAVKEWLLEHDWSVIGFQPPKAQGTFSIPNPAKDPKYKGQTGTTGPDIIAVKQDHVVVVECKDFSKTKVMKDIDKLIRLMSNEPRVELLKRIIKNTCDGNDIHMPTDFHIIMAIGYGGKLLITETTERENITAEQLKASLPKIQTFHIIIPDKTRQIEEMQADVDPSSTIHTTLYPTDCDIKDILLCGKSKKEH